MRQWLQLVTASPWTTVALVAAVTVMLAAQLPRLRLETDGHAFVPPDDPAVRQDKSLRELFRLRDPLLIALDASSDGGAFSPQFLAKLSKVTEAMRKVEGIDPGSIVSLATIERVERRGGKIAITPLIESAAIGKPASDEVRRYVYRSAPYPGLLVSRKADAAIVIAALEKSTQRKEVYESIRRQLRAMGIHAFHIAGPVAAESQLGVYVIDDLVTMLPLVSAVTGFVLFLIYRSLRAVVLPIMEVGIVIVSTFGLMAAFGSPVYVVTAIMPVILMAMGVADEIHIFGHYYEQVLLHPDRDRKTLAVEAVHAVWRPVIFTSITTALGFLSFLGASMPALRSFGVYTAFGIMAAMVCSLSLIPASLALLPVVAKAPLQRQVEAGEDLARVGWLARVLGRLGSLVHDRCGWVLALGCAVAAACVPGIRWVHADDSWFGNFPPKSEVRKAGDFLDAKFAGSHELDIVLDSGAAGGALDPEFLSRIKALTSRVRQLPGVGAAFSLVEILRLMRRDLLGEEAASLPASRPQAAQLIELASGGSGIEPDNLIDRDRRRSLIRVFVRQASYRKVSRLLEAVRSAAAYVFSKEEARIFFAGDVMVSQTTVGLIARDQVRTLALALLLVFLSSSWMFGSAEGGLFAVLPLCLAVLLNFAVMGYAGIPLGIATSMFASLAIGIGVDYAIHFLARYGQALEFDGPRAASRVTLATTGRAILNNAAVVALGYLVLGTSSMPPNRMLGLLVALSMATCFIGAVTLLPAALAFFRPSFLSRTGQ